MTPSEVADCLHERSIWAEIKGDAPLAHLCAQAAATIRAQAEQLKIATEALESAKFTLSGSGQIPDEVMAQNAVMAFRTIAAALARIKEAG